jgi:hypothetical protein
MNPSESTDPKDILFYNTPDDDLEGMTNNEFFQILFHPYEDRSPLKFKETLNEEILDKIPIFRVAEELLALLQREKSIKLSGKDDLIPRKFVREIYDKKFLLDDLFEDRTTDIRSEFDAMFLYYGRCALRMAGIIRKYNGKLLITQKGTKLLEEKNRLELFKLFVEAYTDKIHWGFNDLFTDVPVGQMGFGYVLYTLSKFGHEEHDVTFYAEKYLKAFPLTLTYFKNSFFPPEFEFLTCFEVRTMERFCLWFGYIEFIIRDNSEDEQELYIRKTDLLDQVYRFDI